MKEYLTIGTIVLLKNAKKRIMIIGLKPKTNDNGVVYDFCGVPYPEGLLQSDQIGLFNYDQIEKIIVNGYSDDEEKKFKERINEIENKK